MRCKGTGFNYTSNMQAGNVSAKSLEFSWSSMGMPM